MTEPVPEFPYREGVETEHRPRSEEELALIAEIEAKYPPRPSPPDAASASVAQLASEPTKDA